VVVANESERTSDRVETTPAIVVGRPTGTGGQTDGQTDGRTEQAHEESPGLLTLNELIW
jgi:hypothetical protein